MPSEQDRENRSFGIREPLIVPAPDEAEVREALAAKLVAAEARIKVLQAEALANNVEGLRKVLETKISHRIFCGDCASKLEFFDMETPEALATLHNSGWRIYDNIPVCSTCDLKRKHKLVKESWRAD